MAAARRDRSVPRAALLASAASRAGSSAPTDRMVLRCLAVRQPGVNGLHAGVHHHAVRARARVSPSALGAQARSDSADVAIAALDSTRSRHPFGSTAVIHSGDRLLEETVARRLGYAVDSTGRGPFDVKLTIERLSLIGDSAEVVVESTVRLAPRRVHVEVATITLSRARGAWRVSSLRRDSTT